MTAFTKSALLHALWELSRRAGVSFEQFSSWSPVVNERELIVRLGACPGTIRFPLFEKTATLSDRIVTKAWSREPSATIREQVPHFIVPFASQDSLAAEALFVQERAGEFRCTEDLLSAILYTLMRCEEAGTQTRDSHGRFPASASIALRHNFLHRPVVDEYGLAFQQILGILMPGWQPLPRTFSVKLSHDIDDVGMPFRLRSALGHTLQRRSPVATWRDMAGLCSSTPAAHLHAVREICELSSHYGLRSTLYWKFSPPSAFDSGYDLQHHKIRQVLERAERQGVESGVHPGYGTFENRKVLQAEVERVRFALGTREIGGRQHYLRWAPATWSDWESCGLAYDSTVGFADCVGFRCGTCIPFLPWNWEADRAIDLLEIPLIVMDGTLIDYQKLSPDQSLVNVRELVKKCELVGGVFTLLWHNTALFPPYRKHLRPILALLSGARNYDWVPELQQRRAEAAALSRGFGVTPGRSVAAAV